MVRPLCFVDLEATSLGEDSVPIEFGWACEDGQAGSFLIRPATGWTDWSDRSAAVHGIARETLSSGIPVEEAALRVGALARRYVLVSDAPGADGGWIERLLEVVSPPGVMPSPSPCILDARDVAWTATSSLALLPDASTRACNEARNRLLEERERAMRDFPGVRHRAAPDAARLLAGHRALREATLRAMEIAS